MCGRYALSLRVSRVRSRLADQNMPVAEAPDDDDIRTTYNFAPGYHGLIYRADTHDRYVDRQDEHDETEGNDEESGENANDNSVGDDEQTPAQQPDTPDRSQSHKRRRNDKSADEDSPSKKRKTGTTPSKNTYKLQSAKWGFVPFWTKRPPEYGSQLRTINCRDDSLLENRGMWNVSKQRKRCIVICEGFYEWLKKNNGKEKLPHYVKRKDGQLMTFAGLWDMVQYEGTSEKLYSYTIITTDSNAQLKFLHDRMPVILEPGSDAMKTWLDPDNTGWSKELQSMLHPFKGELECYPVDKGVGKVGNNSASFIIPIDSKENKSNIANFFGAQHTKANKDTAQSQDAGIKPDGEEDRNTSWKVETSEDNAPLPKAQDDTDRDLSRKVKEEPSDDMESSTSKLKSEEQSDGNEDLINDHERKEELVKTESHQSPPVKTTPTTSGKKTRSATANNVTAKTPVKDTNAKITSFFGK